MEPENKQKRARCEYKGVSMSYFRMERIREITPMIQRANDNRMTIPQAAKWLGWSASALRNWLRILGMHWHAKPKRTVYRLDKDGWDEKIKAMREQKVSVNKIAIALGVGPWNISRYVRDHGLQSRARKNREQL
jgi:phage antirepressor YoqD-like protein